MTHNRTVSGSGPSGGRLRRLIPRIGLSVLTIILLLAVGEVAVRVLTEIGPRLIVRDPVVGKRYVRDFDGRVYVPEAGEEIGLRFNREGFRGPDFSYSKPGGVRRIAVIGDSMTVLVATEEEKTWPARLEHDLNALSSTDQWQVMNFGVSSASTGQELVLYREVVSRYQPDIVIVALFVGNDVTDNSSRLTRAPRIYFDLDGEDGVRRLPYSASTSGFSAWANQHSRLYVWYRIVSTVTRARMRLAKNRLETRHLVFRTDDPGDLAHAWELTERLISTFAAEVESDGSRFVLAVLPTGPQIYEDLWGEILSAAGDDAASFNPSYPERRLQAICESHVIPCVTMLDRMRAAGQRESSDGEEQRLYYDHGRRHFNDIGNAFAADIVFDFLTGDSEIVSGS